VTQTTIARVQKSLENYYKTSKIMEKQYFIVLDGQQVGPLTIAQLQNQRINIETLCWYDGLTGWTKARELPELAFMFVYTPPPLPIQPLPPTPVAPQPNPPQWANQVPTTGKELAGYEYYLGGWRKYAEFSGRARRKEFWYFTLFHFLICFGLGILMGANPYEEIYILLYFLYVFASAIPNLAVLARRLHDVGESGWLMLIPILNLILACKSGDVGLNRYGEDPKGG
jgi:uncharacterized membrane protein YhaH (DUF805 family)